MSLGDICYWWRLKVYERSMPWRKNGKMKEGEAPPKSSGKRRWRQVDGSKEVEGKGRKGSWPVAGGAERSRANWLMWGPNP